MTAAAPMPLVQGSWEDLERLIGVELEPVPGADTVNPMDFRRLLELLVWDSPIHTDPAAADEAGYRDVVSPRALTRAWGLPAYWTPDSGEDDIATLVRAPLTLLPGEGTAMDGTGNAFEYFTDVYPGDRLTTTSVLRSVTRKETRVGAGAFLVMDAIYRNQNGTVVAIEQGTGFRYTPNDDSPAESETSDRAEPSNAVELPPTDFPPITVALTLQRLVMAAGVTRDFSPIHTDSTAAQAVGAPDAFANVTLIESLIERAVRQWLGQDVRVRRLTTRLSGFACAGQELWLTGVVTRADADSKDISVTISTAAGRASSGEVTVVSNVDLAAHDGQ